MAEKIKKMETPAVASVPAEKTPEDVKEARRNFLAKVGTGIFASLLAPALLSKKFALAAQPAKTPEVQDLPNLPDPKPDEDLILHMMRDLKRALAKPVNQRRWSMVIDLRKCTGCESCTIGCAAENKLPPGVVYRPVLEEELGTFPNVTRRFTPRPCMQCDEPPCTGVCPVNATWKREDGIVEIDYDMCIGCRYCITACPYSARTFDTGRFYGDGAPKEAVALVAAETGESYQKAPIYDYGKKRARAEEASPIGNARKCHFCLHRIEKGMLPNCTTTCIGRATFFGDANDPKSLVSKLIGKGNVIRLKEEMGTKPKVCYLL